MASDAAHTETPRGRLFILAILVAAGLVALLVGVLVGQSRQSGPSAQGETLYAVSLPDADGRQQSIGQWRGKVLVVNFWATWCGPCREEMPQFVKAQGELGARGLQFVGIAADDAAKVRQFASEIGLNYPALIGGFGAIELSKTYGNKVMALPFTIVLDREGRIVHTQLGVLPDAKLREITAPLL